MREKALDLMADISPLMDVMFLLTGSMEKKDAPEHKSFLSTTDTRNNIPIPDFISENNKSFNIYEKVFDGWHA